MRSMRQMLSKPDCDVTRSHDYGSKSRDTVKMAATLSKMAAPLWRTLNRFYKVIFFQKVIFFIKTRNNYGFLFK